MTILTDLDTLFDTRWVTLSKMEGVDTDTLADSGWRNRIYDRYPMVDYEAYLALYNNRDLGYLQKAAATGAIKLINIILASDYGDMKNDPTLDNPRPQLIVNTWPYRLVDEEISVLLKLIANAVGETRGQVKLVHYSFSELTPYKLISLGVNDLVLYDGIAWTHACWERDQCRQEVCPNITLLVPQLISVELDNPAADMRGPRTEERFTNQENLLAPLVRVDHLPATLFSDMTLPDNKPIY